MKTLNIIMALLAGGLLTFSCQKDSIAPENELQTEYSVQNDSTLYKIWKLDSVVAQIKINSSRWYCYDNLSVYTDYIWDMTDTTIVTRNSAFEGIFNASSALELHDSILSSSNAIFFGQYKKTLGEKTATAKVMDLQRTGMVLYGEFLAYQYAVDHGSCSFYDKQTNGNGGDDIEQRLWFYFSPQ